MGAPGLCRCARRRRSGGRQWGNGRGGREDERVRFQKKKQKTLRGSFAKRRKKQGIPRKQVRKDKGGPSCKKRGRGGARPAGILQARLLCGGAEAEPLSSGHLRRREGETRMSLLSTVAPGFRKSHRPPAPARPDTHTRAQAPAPPAEHGKPGRGRAGSDSQGRPRTPASREPGTACALPARTTAPSLRGHRSRTFLPASRNSPEEER